MQALIEVVLPVFLVIGFGYVVVWRRLFSDSGVDGVMGFATNFAVPCLLFSAIAKIEIGAEFDPRLLGSFYTGALAGFAAGLAGARLIFRRGWEDSVAIGFACLFSNSMLLGLPITERAYGSDSLGPNYAIVALHSPFCYVIGITAMEVVRNAGGGFLVSLARVLRAIFSNALVIGITLGFAVNISGLPLPGVVWGALDMVVRAAIPVALFAMGGVLYRYRPEGDLRTIGYVCLVSLVLHPAIVWMMGRGLSLDQGQFRSAVLTAAMAPGINAYVFASMYGAAQRVASSSVLVGTGLCVLTTWVWLELLG